MGLVDWPAVAAATAVATAAAVSIAWPSGAPRLSRRARAVVGLGLGLVAIGILQCTPLPRSVVEFVSPGAADVWVRSVDPLGEPAPTWMTLSLDPTATRIEVLRHSLYLATVIAALFIAARRDGSRWIQRCLIASAAVIAVVAVIHAAVGADHVYGFYEPRTGVGIIAPLLNSNHLAAYANVGLILALASLFADEPVLPRTLLVGVVLGLVGAQIWLASRGAVAALLFAAAGLGAATLGRKRPAIVGPMVVALGGVIMGVVAMAPGSVSGLTDPDFSKLALTGSVFVRMVPSFPLVGVGRGAFESSFPAFREGTMFIVWTHPENLVAQWTSELGVPVTVVSLAVLGWVFRPTTLRRTRSTALGPWLVIAATVLHNMVDFNMETPCVVVALCGCAGIVLRGDVDPGDGRHADLPAGGLRLGWPILASVIGSTIGIILAFTAGPELVDDRASLRSAVPVEASSDSDFAARLSGAIHRHPAEPYFRYLGGERSELVGDGDTVMWAGRCLERAPVYPPAHFLLARHFRHRSPSQARLEYRIAAEQSNEAPSVGAVLPLVTGFEDVIALTPSNAHALEFLEEVSVAVASRLPATRVQVDAELLRRQPTLAAPLIRRSHDAILDLRDAPWCVSQVPVCVQDALLAALAAEHAAPERCAPYTDRAWVRFWMGSTEDAVTLLEEAATHVQDAPNCLEELANIGTSAQRFDVATGAVDRLARAPCSVGYPCLENILRAAAIEGERGGTARSVVLLRRAVEVAPDDPTALQRLAAAASAAGMHAESANAYERLAAVTGDGRYRTSAAAERQRAFER